MGELEGLLYREGAVVWRPHTAVYIYRERETERKLLSVVLILIHILLERAVV